MWGDIGVHVGRYRLAVWFGLRWDTGTDFEYWRRWCCGPFYVLRYHTDAEMRARRVRQGRRRR